jgi:hypothetical protein
MGRLARLAVHRAHAQALPQLAQGTEHRRLGQLTAQDFACLFGSERVLLIQDLPEFEHQGRDFVAGGFLRRFFPVGIGAQGKHGREGIAVGQEIGLLAHDAKQIQGYDRAGSDQPHQQGLRLFDRGEGGRGLRFAQARFDKRRCGCGQLRMAGKVEAQRMLADPALRIVKGEEGTLVLAPVRRPCCLELLCYQETSFSRGTYPAMLTTGLAVRTEAGRWSAVE